MLKRKLQNRHIVIAILRAVSAADDDKVNR